MVGSAGFLATAVQERLWVELVRFAPPKGEVMVGTPEGAIAATWKETAPVGPQVDDVNPPLQPWTVKVYDPLGRLTRAVVEELASDPEKTVSPVAVFRMRSA